MIAVAQDKWGNSWWIYWKSVNINFTSNVKFYSTLSFLDRWWWLQWHKINEAIDGGYRLSLCLRAPWGPTILHAAQTVKRKQGTDTVLEQQTINYFTSDTLLEHPGDPPRLCRTNCKKKKGIVNHKLLFIGLAIVLEHRKLVIWISDNFHSSFSPSYYIYRQQGFFSSPKVWVLQKMSKVPL